MLSVATKTKKDNNSTKGIFPLKSVRITGMSMYPKLLSGEQVFVMRTAIKDLEKGDIILVRRHDPFRYVVHRLRNIKYTERGLTVITRGDASDADDPAVKEDDVVGRVIGVWREDRMVWLKELEEMSYPVYINDDSEEDPDKIRRRNLSNEPAIDGMKVLDLRKFKPKDVKNLSTVTNIQTVLLNTENEQAWKDGWREKIGKTVTVPVGLTVFTGQVDISGPLLRSLEDRLQVLVVGQMFMGGVTPEDIDNKVDYVMLNGHAFIDNKETAAALKKKLRVGKEQSYYLVIMPSVHVRWLGKGFLDQDILKSWESRRSLVVVGPLHVSYDTTSELIEQKIDVFFCSSKVICPPHCKEILDEKRAVVWRS